MNFTKLLHAGGVDRRVLFGDGGLPAWLLDDDTSPAQGIVVSVEHDGDVRPLGVGRVVLGNRQPALVAARVADHQVLLAVLVRLGRVVLGVPGEVVVDILGVSRLGGFGKIHNRTADRGTGFGVSGVFVPRVLGKGQRRGLLGRSAGGIPCRTRRTARDIDRGRIQLERKPGRDARSHHERQTESRYFFPAHIYITSQPSRFRRDAPLMHPAFLHPARAPENRPLFSGGGKTR